MAQANRLYRRDKAEQHKTRAAEERARERARRLNAEEIAAAGFARKQEEGPYASLLKDKAAKLNGVILLLLVHHGNEPNDPDIILNMMMMEKRFIK